VILTTEQISSILDRVRVPLEAAGVKYTAPLYDPLTGIYDISLHTDGLVDRHGNPDPHKALLAMRAALRKAGYTMVERVSGYTGGFWWVRFILEDVDLSKG
jgi:hypothetical protein